MSTARGRDGGKTQSGGVKGVIAPDPDPGIAEPDNDHDGTISRLHGMSFDLTCLHSMFTFSLARSVLAGGQL